MPPRHEPPPIRRHRVSLTNLTSGLDGVVQALSNRGNQTEAERLLKGEAALALIMSFLPGHVIELTLAGQIVLFNELLADGAHDVLRGMTETLKTRSHANLVNMGRVVQGHVDRLRSLGNKPAKINHAAPRARPRAAAKAVMREHPDPVQPRPAAAAPPARFPAMNDGPAHAHSRSLRRSDAAHARSAGAEDSWLDGPFEQWIVETPTDAAARMRLPSVGTSAATVPPPASGTEPSRSGCRPSNVGVVLPREPNGYLPVLAALKTGLTAGD